MNQHDLITRIRSGGQAAFASLLSEYEPLVRAEVARHATGLSSEDAEDLHQVALLALYRAAMGFDLAQKEVEFGLYAKICISNALASQLRALRRRTAELPLPDDFSIDAGEDPASRVMEEEAAALLYGRIRSVLSPYECRVWNLYTMGYRSGEIARMLGKEPHSVENAVYRIRRKLRQTLAGEH
ncbi:MAG: sigma-70 family RNA polymerase sigma factor [Ruminococcaceae bacterium]|nr:sigma-70 family RNA polymerase sigma factor [Oscillospiraceae bacterium]